MNKILNEIGKKMVRQAELEAEIMLISLDITRLIQKYEAKETENNE